VRLLARAAGHAGMAGGQAIDLAATGKPLDEAALRDMHRRKTGALLQASVLMGAATGGCHPAAWQAAVSDYGAAIGLAFQVVDDILDVTQASDTLGKTAGKDLDANKPTYVTVLGLDEARHQAQALHRRRWTRWPAGPPTPLPAPAGRHGRRPRQLNKALHAPPCCHRSTPGRPAPPAAGQL
jgi:geranylgeranyl pyrophosphate synthase